MSDLRLKAFRWDRSSPPPPLSYHTFRLNGEKASKGGAERRSFQGKIALVFCEKVLGRSVGSGLSLTCGGVWRLWGGEEGNWGELRRMIRHQ